MRRATPLVIIVEDYFQYNASIGIQFALDAVFQRYDMSNPQTHKASIVKPFTSVTVVVSEDFLKYRSIILDAAERSDGKLRVEVLGSGRTPRLVPESYQLSVPGPSSSSSSTAGNEAAAETLVRFAVILNCSKRFHDKMPVVSDAGNIVDMIQYCSISKSVPRDAIYMTTVSKLEAFCHTGNLWLDRSYVNSSSAANTIGSSMRNIASENLHAIIKSRDTNAHWNNSVAVQFVGIAAIFGLSGWLAMMSK